MLVSVNASSQGIPCLYKCGKVLGFVTMIVTQVANALMAWSWMSYASSNSETSREIRVPSLQQQYGTHLEANMIKNIRSTILYS